MPFLPHFYCSSQPALPYCAPSLLQFTPSSLNTGTVLSFSSKFEASSQDNLATSQSQQDINPFPDWPNFYQSGSPSIDQSPDTVGRRHSLNSSHSIHPTVHNNEHATGLEGTDWDMTGVINSTDHTIHGLKHFQEYNIEVNHLFILLKY